MKIAIVVQGRFHAFDLARELIGLGHEVLLLTNYPRNWPERFGVPRQNVKSLLAHGILSRTALALGKAAGNEKYGEAFLHQWFGRWSAKQLVGQEADLTHLFSGVALETLLQKERTGNVHSLMRGSSHIVSQKKILEEEGQRSGQRIELPSDWMIQREVAEYSSADLIVCLSLFAHESFLGQGFPERKLVRNPLGVEQSLFQASAEILKRRKERILHGRLKVLITGNFSLQKGALDMLWIAEKLSGRMDFYVRGSISPDAMHLIKRADGKIHFLAKTEQRKLPQDYFESDLFLFPTLQDGYGAVLAQASAAGLPVLATTNCGARDFLTDGKDAWIFPIRRPDLMMKRLDWCDKNRGELASIAEAAGKTKAFMDWRHHAQKLVEAHDEFMRRANRQHSGLRA